MKTKILSLFFLVLILTKLVNAQTSAISATITDTNGQAWFSGTYSITFRPVPGNPGPYVTRPGGTSFTQTFTGTLDNTGSFSIPAIQQNDHISPANSQWIFSICPAATSNCQVTILSITSANCNTSCSLTTQLTPPPPQVKALATSYAYNDSEIAQQSMGVFYINLTDNAIHYCSTIPPCTWLALQANGTNPTFNNITVNGTATINKLDVTGQAIIKDLVTGGPIVDIRYYGGTNSIQNTTASTTLNSTTIQLAGAIDFANGQSFGLFHAGSTCSLLPPASLTVEHQTTPGITPGSTTSVTYQIVALGGSGSSLNGCVSAASSAVTATCPVTDTDFDYCQMYWATVTNASKYAVYKGTSLVGETGDVFWDDHGTGTGGIPDFVPATPPSSALASTLFGQIVSGGGTTTIVSSVAAGATISSQLIQHDNAPAIQYAFNNAPKNATIYFPPITQELQYTYDANCHKVSGFLYVPSYVTWGIEVLQPNSDSQCTFTVLPGTIIERQNSIADNGYPADVFVDYANIQSVEAIYPSGYQAVTGDFTSAQLVANFMPNMLGLVDPKANLSRGGCGLCGQIAGALGGSGLSTGIIATSNITANVSGACYAFGETNGVQDSFNKCDNSNAPRNFYPIAQTEITATTNSTTITVAYGGICESGEEAFLYSSGVEYAMASVTGGGATSCTVSNTVSVTSGDYLEIRRAGGYGHDVYQEEGSEDLSGTASPPISSITSETNYQSLGFSSSVCPTLTPGEELEFVSSLGVIRTSTIPPHIIYISQNCETIYVDFVPTNTVVTDVIYPNALGRNAQVTDNLTTNTDGFGGYCQTTPYTLFQGNIYTNVLRAGPQDASLAWAGVTEANCEAFKSDNEQIRFTGSNVPQLFPTQTAFITSQQAGSHGLRLSNGANISVTSGTIKWVNGNALELDALAGDYIENISVTNMDLYNPTSNCVLATGNGNFNQIKLNHITCDGAGMGGATWGVATASGFNIAGPGTFTNLTLDSDIVSNSAGHAFSITPTTTYNSSIIGNNVYNNALQTTNAAAWVVENVTGLTFKTNNTNGPSTAACATFSSNTAAIIGEGNTWVGCTSPLPDTTSHNGGTFTVSGTGTTQTFAITTYPTFTSSGTCTLQASDAAASAMNAAGVSEYCVAGSGGNAGKAVIVFTAAPTSGATFTLTYTTN